MYQIIILINIINLKHQLQETQEEINLYQNKTKKFYGAEYLVSKV